MTQPFTYVIGWTNHKIYYYGCRYRVGCSPDDLWKTYFTSSKQVSAFRHQYGEPDVIRIHRICITGSEALELEEKFLLKVDAANSINWLNCHNGAKNFIARKGKEHHTYNVPRSESWRNRHSLSLKTSGKVKGANNGMYGKSHSEKVRLEQSIRVSGINHPMFGKPKSDSFKKNLSEKYKGKSRPTTQCPHCSKIGGIGVMKRWHFDNCKLS